MHRFVIFFLLGLSLNTQAAEHPIWKADFKTKPGLVQILASLNTRHPGFLRSQVRFKADISRLFRDAGEITEALGPLAHQATEIKAQPITSLSWSDGGAAAEYNADAVEALKLELKSKLTQLHDANPDLRLTSLDSDLQNVSDRRLLMETAALLYDEEGNSIYRSSPQPFQKVAQGLATLSAATLETVFGDLFKNHLRPKLNSQNGKLAAEVERGFFAKAVRPALTKTQTGSTSVSHIFLEEIPKAIALLRGAIGFDCSMMSVPFYPLLDKVHVYWIRKGKNPKDSPRGYILIADIEMDGNIVPYVITINGETLSSQDARAALLAAVAKYKTNRVLVHAKGIEGVVNREDMEVALFQYEDRGEVVNVQMPEGWKQIDESARYGYARYYETSRLSTARLITLNENEIRALRQVESTGKVGYYAQTDVSQLKTMDRALLFADIFDLKERVPSAEELETFGIGLPQALLAKELKKIGSQEVYSFKPTPAEAVLTPEQFATFKVEFGMDPADVFKYWSSLTAAQQLATMWRDDLKQIFEPQALKTLIEDVRARLVRDLEELNGDTDTLAILLFSLPDAGVNDRQLTDLIFKYGRGRFYMNSAIDKMKGGQEFSPLLVQLVSRYNYSQPVWARLLAVHIWNKIDEKRKSRVYWKQFRAFLGDPDPRVRAKTLGAARHKSHRGRDFWTSLLKGSTDPNLQVREAAAGVWQNLRDTRMEFPIEAWPVIEDLLSDPSVSIRTQVLESLAQQKIWPLPIWQKIPGLLMDMKTSTYAVKALYGKQWPQEVWALIAALSRNYEPTSYHHDELRSALHTQEPWTTQMVEAAEEYLENRPRKGTNYDPERWKSLIQYKKERAVDVKTLPTLAQQSCENLLNEKREPLFLRMLDRVFEFFD